MGSGGIEDIDNVAGSNSVAVQRLGKESRRDARICYPCCLIMSVASGKCKKLDQT